MNNNIFCIFLCLLIGIKIQAQEKYTLNGMVSDVDGNPISNANVQILENSKIIAYTFTNEEGCYSLSFNSFKTQILLSVGHMSFENSKIMVDCKETKKNITLLEKKTLLKEVFVKAPKISQRKDTISYQLSSFIGKGDYKLRDAMKQLPGVEVMASGAIKYLGKEISNFYIESMDLFGGKYNIATNNIPAEYVTTVQVINNHKDAKIDKDMLSDDVAINIKLSKRAKFRPVGTYEISGGLNNKFGSYQANGAGMLFKSHTQILGILKTGNIKEFSTDEYINHFQDDNIESVGIKLLGNLSTSSAPLKRDRYINPKDAAANFNILKKISENKSLRTNIGYAYSQNKYAYNHKMFFGLNELMLDYQYKPTSTLHKPTLSIEYKENSKNRYLINRFSTLASFILSDLPTIEKESNSSLQNEKYNDLGISNNFSVRWKTDNFYWNFSSLLNYTTVPNGNICVTDIASGSFQQNVSSRQFTNKEIVSITYEKRNSRIDFPLLFLYQNERINSTLFAYEHSDLNLLKGNKLQFSFNPQYEYTHPQRKYNFKTKISFTAIGIDFKNKGTIALNKQKWYFTIDPSFYLLYNVTPRATIKFQGILAHEFGDGADFITAPIQNNLHYQKYSLGILAEKRSFTLNATYGLKFPIEMFFLNIGSEYKHQHNNLLSAKDVSQTLIKEFPILNPNNIDNLSAYFNIMKQVESIHTKFSLYGIYMHNKNYMMQNGNIYSYSWNNLNVIPSVSIKPMSFMELYYTYNFSKNFTKIQQKSNALISQTHAINLILKPITNLQIKAKTDIATKQIYQDLTKTMTIFDTGISYRIKAFQFNLDIRNLLNQKYYSYTMFNSLNTYTYIYNLRGRELLFTVSWTK